MEYLVNYSSQLIFVSGESIAQQQKTLEAFVFQQHDDTEIAYLTAQDNMEPSDYRRQLCRQLLGQVVGSFVRPLNELLSDLNSHEGPILIAITQAHNLPDALLQELWDLVLQSRFAGNKQHLNVLLFANNDWAERAKQWLPAKNTETPLIISSQSVMSEQPNFASDLDKMIASRREAFQAHLENRQRENTQTFSNPLKTTWFYAAVACVFLITFSGLVYWQYGNKLATLFSPIEQQSQEFQTPQVQPGSAYSTLLSDENSNIDDSQRGDRQHLDEIASAAANVELVVASNESEDTQAETTDGNALVTAWNDAVSSLPPSTKTSKQQGTTPDTTDEDNSGESLSNQGSAVTNIKDVDAPIVEISKPAQTSDSTTNDKGVEDAPSKNAEWIAENEYAIQMLAMKDKSVLNAFLSENDLLTRTRIYKTTRYGGDWFVVVDKQVYSSISQAQQGRAALPEYPGKQNAFVKRGRQILSEISKN
nr:cell division protein DamX [Alteromonas sp. IB21]